MLPPPPGSAGYGGQQPPRRRVRKGLLITGIMLMVLAPILFCAGFLWALVPLMSTDATVPVDGTATRVDLPPDTTRALYVDSTTTWGQLSCEVVDASGTPVELRGVTGDVEVNDFTAARSFDTGDGDLTITCRTGGDAFPGSDEVRVAAVPGKGFAIAIVASFAVPALVFLIGLLLLIIALVRRRPA